MKTIYVGKVYGCVDLVVTPRPVPQLVPNHWRARLLRRLAPARWDRWARKYLAPELRGGDIETRGYRT